MISFIIAPVRITCLGINLFEKVQYLYTDNYRTLLEEIKEDLNQWKDILCPWVGSCNMVKIKIQLKAITDSIQSYQKVAFFTGMAKKNSIFLKNSKCPPKTKAILKCKEEHSLFQRSLTALSNTWQSSIYRLSHLFSSFVSRHNLTLSPRLEYGGTNTAHCSMEFSGL